MLAVKCDIWKLDFQKWVNLDSLHISHIGFCLKLSIVREPGDAVGKQKEKNQQLKLPKCYFFPRENSGFISTLTWSERVQLDTRDRNPEIEKLLFLTGTLHLLTNFLLSGSIRLYKIKIEYNLDYKWKSIIFGSSLLDKLWYQTFRALHLRQESLWLSMLLRQ